jgi:transaldolase
MKIFIDSADVNEIREAMRIGCADGVTTNPTLIARAGVDLEKTIRAISEIVHGPVNAEVTSTTAHEMVAEGKTLHRWGENVHVKIPLNHEGLIACKELADEGIPSTLTLIFSPTQAILAARAGAAWICPFVGRLDDISYDGMELIRQIAVIYNHDVDGETSILAASLRHPVHVVECALAGADAITVPYAVIRQMEQHPLTERGIKQFLADAKKT